MSPQFRVGDRTGWYEGDARTGWLLSDVSRYKSCKMSRFGIEEFETMFREEYRRCLFTALQIVRDAETGRDIVSDSFAAVWNNRDSIEPGKMRSYLYQCVRNKSLTQFKHIHRTEPAGDDAAMVVPADDGDDRLLREKRIEAVERELGLLPERTRYVLEQCYYKRRTYREVADELGISTNGIKKHIVKAMAHLRSALT